MATSTKIIGIIHFLISSNVNHNCKKYYFHKWVKSKVITYYFHKCLIELCTSQRKEAVRMIPKFNKHITVGKCISF